MDTDLQFQLKIIDYYTTFEYLLGYRSNEYIDLNPSSYIPNSTVYCPFHQNVDTKAAKLYEKDKNTNTEKLYCFAENKLYYPHSLLSPPKNIVDPKVNYLFKSIIPYDPVWVFSAIWNHLSEEEKHYWETENPNIVIKNNFTKFSPLYKVYREGSIDMFSLLNSISKK